MKPIFHSIEPLEARVAPAAVISATIVQFKDVDGDLITVKSSKPIFTTNTADAGVFTFDTGSLDGTTTAAQQLQLIDLTKLPTAQKALAAGDSLTITATPQSGHGNGLVNIGEINASVDL